jgi:hypothetical protein
MARPFGIQPAHSCSQMLFLKRHPTPGIFMPAENKKMLRVPSCGIPAEEYRNFVYSIFSCCFIGFD